MVSLGYYLYMHEPTAYEVCLAFYMVLLATFIALRVNHVCPLDQQQLSF